jgi:DNA-binding response OmpR family regulator
VVEDAPEVVNSIVLSLSVRWPSVALIATSSGREAIQLTQNTAPDIVLLDLTLNDLYGLVVLKEVRRFSNAPLIIITANKEETTRRRSMEMGATDYLVKPFSHIDLLRSVYSALGRSGQAKEKRDETALLHDGIVIDLVSRKLLRGGSEVGLTAIEWRIFTALIQNEGRVVPNTQLSHAGWGRDSVPRSSLTTCIRQLRLKLGDDRAHPKMIQLQRNEGYVLNLFH